jgi:hypothetical protein
MMNDLLNLAIKAHGGLERWKQVRSLQAKVTLNGALWRIKGRPNGLPGVLMRADTRQPAMTITPFPSPGSVGHFTPDRVWIGGENNKLVSELNKPRDSFAGAVLTTKWNELQELYFVAYAFWNYFSIPFLLAQPGVEVEEIEPHTEDGETWRTLRVIFPPEIPTHSAHQTLYPGFAIWTHLFLPPMLPNEPRALQRATSPILRPSWSGTTPYLILGRERRLSSASQPSEDATAQSRRLAPLW